MENLLESQNYIEGTNIKYSNEFYISSEDSLNNFTHDDQNSITLSFDNLSQIITASPTQGMEDDLFPDISEQLTIFAAGCCLLFIIVGIPGNFLTIVALARCKKVHNATGYFIINLSLCDLMFCCFNLPLAFSMFWNRSWIHGESLCTLFPFFRYGLMAVSIFTVLAITINRYIMIGHPRLYPRMYRTKYLGLMIILIWIGSFAAIIPTLFGYWGRFELDRGIASCSIIKDSKNRSPKTFLFIMAFILPCCAIIICYARIFFIVRQATVNSRPVELGPSCPGELRSCMNPDEAAIRRPSEFARPSMAVIHQRGKMTSKDKKLLMMILVIFGTFVLCHLPITLVKIISKEEKNSEWNIFGYILIYLTTCMNPFIYVVMSSEYRQAYKSIILCKNELWNLSRSHYLSGNYTQTNGREHSSGRSHNVQTDSSSA